MNEEWNEKLSLLKQLGDLQVSDIRKIPPKQPISNVFHIKHRFKEKIIVPLVAINNGIDFLLNHENISVITADNVECDVLNCRKSHFGELENEIFTLYHLDPWTFYRKWYGVYKEYLGSHFVIMELKKKR